VLTRAEMKGKAQTVLGLVDPASLGNVLMHEHLLWDLNPPDRPPLPEGMPLAHWWGLANSETHTADNLRNRSVDVAVEAVAEAHAAGCGAIVELTIGGLKPDPKGLAEASRRTGCAIVMGCGWYVDQYQHNDNRNRSADSFAEEMIAQVQQGAWDTDVRAGIVGEIGCQWPWTGREKLCLTGAVVAMQETGAALTIHPARVPDHPMQLVEFLRPLGCDLSRTIIDHIDRTIGDDDRLFALADSGVVLEWDLFGQEATYYAHSDFDMPNDIQRLRDIRKLIDRGHLDQIVISHDICHLSHFTAYGGWGYAHIFKRVVPRALKRGFTQDELDAILIHNPRRLLTFV
jgi:phosphotriesterase-related protein